FFDRRVGQIEPLLQEVDAQRPFQPDRRPAVARLRIERLDQCATLAPRHYPPHLSQERRASRRLGVSVKAGCRQRHLLHHRVPRRKQSETSTYQTLTRWT